jgi:6-phosphogluconate dehydrogenase
MQLAMIGLGRMGSNMARRLAAGGHEVIAWDRDAAAVSRAASAGAVGASSIEDLVRRLSPPRTVWIMVPAGEPTEQTVAALGAALSPDDVIIDGGNSYYKDDVRRARTLGAAGIHYVDVGTSGGVWGADRGYCLMVGGPRPVFERLTPLLRTLAPGTGGIEPSEGLDPSATTAHEGFLHCGPAGAGHFVKMIHNGIEYGLMQAYAEGFDILRNASSTALPEDHRFDFDLAQIAEVWRRGSVVSSWLLDLTARALFADPALDAFVGQVQDSGEGRWTVAAAIEEAVPADVLTTALYVRFRSRQDHTFAEKLLSALRAQFGGHVEPPR